MIKPILTNYSDPRAYIADMLRFLKAEDPNFSVLQATKGLRKVSPTLVSLILRGKRKLTFDRVDEFSKMLRLTSPERRYLKDWIQRLEGRHADPSTEIRPPQLTRRKVTSSHILSDWINVFVKDAFQMDQISQNPEDVYAALGGIASRKRIEQSIKFLLKNGFLRTTLDGHIVPETPLHSIDPKLPNHKIRNFHKAVLSNAQKAIDQYSPDQRYANAMVITLNENTYQKLIELISEQAEELQSFAETLSEGRKLYQLVINLSPTGGIHDSTETE